MNKNQLVCNLALFDGGEGTGAAAVGAEGAGNQGEAQGTVRGTTRRGKSGEYANVVFGKQNATVTDAQDNSDAAGRTEKDADNPTTSNTLEARRKAFSDLVNGEYKDIYTEETQRIIDRRFKETRQLEAQAAKNQPLIDMLMQRYNIADGDVDKLMQAVENDNAYLSGAAEEAGMTVEQYKQFERLKRENAAFLKAERERQGRQQMEQQLQRWYGEAEQVKAKYPGFDLMAEVQNQQFMSMLKSGVPVEHAYKVIHMDDIVTEAMRTTAADTEKRIVDNVRAKGARPSENGTAAQSAFIVKDDVSKFTKADRREIAKRAARGEIIEL